MVRERKVSWSHGICIYDENTSWEYQKIDEEKGRDAGGSCAVGFCLIAVGGGGDTDSGNPWKGAPKLLRPLTAHRGVLATRACGPSMHPPLLSLSFHSSFLARQINES